MSTMQVQGYHKQFDIDLERGQVGEALVEAGLTGTIEVKTDSWTPRTGCHYIETSCKGRPSGIWATEADWWFVVVPTTGAMVGIPIDRVQELVWVEEDAGRVYKTAKDPANPTEGVVLRLADLLGIPRDADPKRRGAPAS